MLNPNNHPLHAPLYSSITSYEGDCEGISILLEVDEEAVRSILKPTPLEFVSSYAWIEVVKYDWTKNFAPYEDTFGAPYTSFGVVIPASYEGNVGGFYAHCFKNKDYGGMAGREMGFPIKYGRIHFQRTGRAVTAELCSPTAAARASLVVGEGPNRPSVLAPNSPTFLVQVLPDVETDGVMLRQLVSRDVSASSSLEHLPAEGAFDLEEAASGVDDLSWLGDSRPVYAEYMSGRFRGNTGKVLLTDWVSPGLRARI
ncbi:acetoacetate decarboxylase family protein [Leucobacter sp. GX24907]